MSLPETIRVKLSSEEAGAVSITAVVVQDMPLRELIELMLGVTGKDHARIHGLLLRGTLVSGASRFRWTGWEAEPESIDALLATFPDPDPALPFAPERCVRAVFHGSGRRIEVTREAGRRRRLLRTGRFWDRLLEIVAAEPPRYAEYSYKERADRYRLDLSCSAGARVKESAGMLPFPTLGAQLRRSVLEWVDLFVERLPGS